MNELERRNSPAGPGAPVDLRSGTRGEGRAVGYGALFNSETVIGNEFREVIRPGTFDRYLAKAPDIAICFNHDPSRLIGTTKSGTATVTIDDRGVKYDAELDPSDPDAVALRAKLQRGKVRGSSFTFRVTRDGQKWHAPTSRGGLPLREIVQAELYELGPVTFPAYPTTSAAVRDAVRRLRSAPDRARRDRWFAAAASLVASGR